jgi:Protein of unknown function (DUF3300)
VPADLFERYRGIRTWCPCRLVAALALIGMLVASPVHAQSAPPAAAAAAPVESAAPAKLTPDELDKLCAPVALYPDALLAQVLMAAAYPLDVVQADRWLAKNEGLTGEKMEDALKNESWDISIKILTHFPAVLKYMDQNLDWTSALGDAVVNQQPDVMASIQHLRSQAYALGNLKSGPQQTVTVSDGNIVIQPADGETIYVPQYDPAVAYTKGPQTAAAQPAAVAAEQPAAPAVQPAAPPPEPAPAPATTSGSETSTTVVAPPASTTTVVTQPSSSTTVVTQPSTTVVTEPGYSSSDVLMTGLVSFGAGMLVGGLIADNNNDWCDWNGGAVVVPRGGYGGYAGWGRPPPGYGGRNGYRSGNNVNVSGNTVNVNNSRRWSPDNSRRSATGGATSATRQTRGNFGYAAGANAGSGRGQAGAGNAFGGYNRASTARQDSARGAQSLAGARANGSVPPRAGAARPVATTARPAATRPATATARPAATRPAGTAANPASTRAIPQTGNVNRQRNAGGGAPPAFGVNAGGRDRVASTRGRGSMGSARRQGFKPSGGRGR